MKEFLIKHWWILLLSSNAIYIAYDFVRKTSPTDDLATNIQTLTILFIGIGGLGIVFVQNTHAKNIDTLGKKRALTAILLSKLTILKQILELHKKNKNSISEKSFQETIFTLSSNLNLLETTELKKTEYLESISDAVADHLMKTIHNFDHIAFLQSTLHAQFNRYETQLQEMEQTIEKYSIMRSKLASTRDIDKFILQKEKYKEEYIETHSRLVKEIAIGAQDFYVDAQLEIANCINRINNTNTIDLTSLITFQKSRA